MSKSRLALAATLVILISVFFSLGLDSYLTLEAFRAQQSELQTLVNEQFGFMVAAFFGIYVAVTALSIPGAAVMTLAAGALFGLLSGTIIVSFASTLGATLAFLLARFLFRSTVKKRFASTIERIDTGIDKEGAYYLFTLRLVPIFPFFAINLAMALTRLRTLTFALISQIGMLPGTIVYVNAGTQLGRIESTADIASPALIGSFVLLGLFPLLTKKILGAFNTRKIYQRFTKPKHFDANLVVIGAGAAGLVTSYIAAASKAKVFLIEKNRMGGDCLNTGCVPSKALIRTASIAADIRRASEYGLHADNLRVDFPKVMQRVKAVIADIEPHDSIERYTALGVDCITGAAKIESPWTVRVNDQTITTRNIVIASGGEPFVPPIPGLERIDYLTSDNLWDLQTLPQRLVVLGGGPIGCEMAQAFRRLGSEVTMV
ncbi:MAG: FAD-dependent oxidoreductase, partial [Gammaproteobacteria bacterium]|nr:FAD-dependent oxidoreductase [Gammaproteobacteria bacterium]